MRLATLFIMFTAFAVSTGCSPSNTGTAEGTVSLRGTPISAGSIVFENPATGFSISTPIQADGSFRVKTSKGDGLPAGDYRVAVVPDAFPVTEGTQVLVGMNAAANVQAAQAVPIPQKYRATASTPLMAKVEAGTNPPFQFDLTP